MVSQSPDVYFPRTGDSRTGQPATTGRPTSRPRPARQVRAQVRPQARPPKPAFRLSMAKGQTWTATRIHPASSSADDTVNSKSRTRITRRIVAPSPQVREPPGRHDLPGRSPATPMEHPAQSQHNTGQA